MIAVAARSTRRRAPSPVDGLVAFVKLADIIATSLPKLEVSYFYLAIWNSGKRIGHLYLRPSSAERLNVSVDNGLTHRSSRASRSLGRR
jgi:hypothetical protein